MQTGNPDVTAFSTHRPVSQCTNDDNVMHLLSRHKSGYLAQCHTDSRKQNGEAEMTVCFCFEKGLL